MKIIKSPAFLALAILAFIIGAFVFAIWFPNRDRWREENRQLRNARTLASTYTRDEWISLYDESLRFAEHSTSKHPPASEWPGRVKQLGPSSVYVADDGVYLAWEAPINNVPLLLRVYFKSEPRGVVIYDMRNGKSWWVYQVDAPTQAGSPK